MSKIIFEYQNIMGIWQQDVKFKAFEALNTIDKTKWFFVATTCISMSINFRNLEIWINNNNKHYNISIRGMDMNFINFIKFIKLGI